MNSIILLSLAFLQEKLQSLSLFDKRFILKQLIEATHIPNGIAKDTDYEPFVTEIRSNAALASLPLPIEREVYKFYQKLINICSEL